MMKNGEVIPSLELQLALVWVGSLLTGSKKKGVRSQIHGLARFESSEQARFLRQQAMASHAGMWAQRTLAGVLQGLPDVCSRAQNSFAIPLGMPVYTALRDLELQWDCVTSTCARIPLACPAEFPVSHYTQDRLPPRLFVRRLRRRTNKGAGHLGCHHLSPLRGYRNAHDRLCGLTPTAKCFHHFVVSE